MVAGLVGHDGEQPRAEGGAVAEAVEGAVGAQVGLLEDVVGVVGAGDEDGDAPGHRLVPAQELGERVEIAGPGPADQLAVGRRDLHPVSQAGTARERRAPGRRPGASA